MKPVLRGYATAILESARTEGVATLVADELAQVERLVAGTPALGIALTDTVVPATARRAVVSDLLEARVSAPTLRLVVRVVDTESAPEITVGLHDIAELAILMQGRSDDESRTDDEPLLGRTAARSMIAGYAMAVFETLASVSDLEDIEDELFRFARVVESTPALRNALTDRSLPLPMRRGVVADLLDGRAHTATVRLVNEALRGRARDLVATLDWLVVQAAQARGWRIARVRAARDVDASEREELSRALERLAGAPVELQVFVDESLLGGATVQIGDLLVDATIRHRLEQLQEHLLGAEGETRGAHH
ncbi:MAG TPA: F0F1 ATP synthase subunit delta [Acidimicrobiales bacterium]|nr:F0F1 ATP synthase subunit delta [Acidimicrobiales bacterium]